MVAGQKPTTVAGEKRLSSRTFRDGVYTVHPYSPSCSSQQLILFERFQRRVSVRKENQNLTFETPNLMGIWDVLVEVVMALQHAEGSVKRQWLVASRLEVSWGFLELQSALEGADLHFVNVFIKAIGFLVRLGF